MAGSSPAALREAFAKVRARIGDLRGQCGRVSEQDTKAILIDPVLSALGWRLHELQDVRREYRAKPQDNPVDYALLVFGKPRLFVEAKAFSTPLDRKCAAQVLGYASVVGVGWCLLTNGDEYRVYNSHAKVDVDEKLLRTVRLGDPAQVDLCVETLGLMARDEMDNTRLDLLWKRQFVDRRVKGTLEALFKDDSGSFARLVRRHSGELGLGEVRESLRRAQIHVHFPTVPSGTTGPSSSEDAMPAKKAGAEGSASQPPTSVASKPETAAGHSVTLKDLITAGIVEPPLALCRKYKGVKLEAVVDEDGCVRIGGETYASPSTAAGMARKSVVGSSPGHAFPPTNGWTFWRFEDERTGTLRPIDVLRQAYLERVGA